MAGVEDKVYLVAGVEDTLCLHSFPSSSHSRGGRMLSRISSVSSRPSLKIINFPQNFENIHHFLRIFSAKFSIFPPEFFNISHGIFNISRGIFEYFPRDILIFHAGFSIFPAGLFSLFDHLGEEEAGADFGRGLVDTSSC